MSTDDTTPISPETEQAATIAARLPRNTLTLIGTLTGRGAPRALIRASNGRVLTLSLGERAGRDTVVGIEDGRVHLARGRRSSVLEMPKD